ncbi:MAG: tRNA-dihydrouridine synthase [Elusimicrobiales bacterium]
MTASKRPSELRIGRVTCSNILSLAPMAGISDSALRLLCLRGGAGLVCAEMVSAVALRFGSRRSGDMLEIGPDGHPCAMQIFGQDEAAVRLAAARAAERGADIVDINAGCPVPKIIKSGAGTALMKDERAFARVVAAAVSAAGGAPVTVKTRVGLEKGAPLSARLARIAEGEGASAVFLHGRYARAAHSGPVDLDAVAAACAAVKIPVIGNGGVSDAEGAAAFLSAGCAGVMIGRAAIGDPFIFACIDAGLRGAQYSAPEYGRLELFIEYLELSARQCGPRAAVLRARKTAGFWIRGLPDCALLRAAFMRAENLEQARCVLQEWRRQKL